MASVSLEQHLSIAYAGCKDSMYIRGILSKKGDTSPRFYSWSHKDEIRRIIYFRGSFNPPTVAHMKLLQHALWHCRRTMNAIGAVVVCTPDALTTNSENLVIPLETRLQLWISSGKQLKKLDIVERLKRGWYWLHHGMEPELHVVMQRLSASTSRARYPIHWITLNGPDSIKSLIEEKYDVRLFRVISDVSRRADFMDYVTDWPRDMEDTAGWCVRDGHTIRRPGQEGRGRAARLEAALQRIIEARASGAGGGEPDKGAKECEETVRFWGCVSGSGKTEEGAGASTRGFITFLGSDRTCRSKAMEIETRHIRQAILGAKSKEQLLQELEGKVLNPKWLVRYVLDEVVPASFFKGRSFAAASRAGSASDS